MDDQQPRVTAYGYASRYGLPCDLPFLFALGQYAARIARWEGWEEHQVTEGPYIVHSWPASVWDQAVREYVRLLPPQPVPGEGL